MPNPTPPPTFVDFETPIDAPTFNGLGANVYGNAMSAAESAALAQQYAEAAAAPADDTVAALVGAPLTAPTATSSALDRAYRRRATSALDRMHAVLASSTLRPVHVVVAGDSYIQGLDATRAPLRFVNRLADRLRAAYPSGTPAETPVRRWSDEGVAAPYTIPGVHVVNAGVGGTSSDNYLTSTLLGQVVTLGAAVVIHVVGTNDLATTPPTPVTTYKANVAAKIATIATSLPDAVHVLVHGALRPDAPWHAQVWQDYSAALAQLAEENPATVAYVDISAPFLAAEIPGDDPYDLMTDGGIHPNDAGHALMADEAVRALGIAGPVPRDWFVVDTFTRPAAAALGSAETRQAWSVLGSAVYTIATGKAVPTTVGVAVVDAVRTDVEVAATCTFGGSLVGFVLRCNDVNNYLIVTISATQVALYKVVAGATTILAQQSVAHTAGVDYQLRAVIVGSTVTVYENGRVVLPAFTLASGDATTFASWSKVGLYSGGTAAMKFDDFGVRPA